jgi:hypothetical protein
LLGRGHGKKSGGLAIVVGLVYRFRLQRHGLGIGAIEAGIIEAVVDPQGDRDKPRTTARQELEYGDGTWSALVVFLLAVLRLAWLLIRVLRPVANLGRARVP